ncbi:complex I subunit 5 family protein [Ectothiorhodospira shaposhnikovii]|uniref:complex I subunit 5 family protein n=1 Tax=Ectothiorhodospira shaposhnikovii TaxID=1054 RepID=UPI001EE88A97|nr:NADH-quinone oxidoreductase subunit J [Ectothiorhodospira shaposhnikovii]
MSPVTATPEGFLLVLAIFGPVLGIPLLLVLGGRHAERIGLVLLALELGIVVAIAATVIRRGDALEYVLGGWAPPLGVLLRADGLSIVMLATTAVVIGAAGLYARSDFGMPRGIPETRAPRVFWTLLLTIWAALNAVFLASDLFTLFVALELLTLGAVPLVGLSGRAEALTAALRYLLFSLLGSALFLLGVALLYGSYGTLDIALLAERVRVEPTTQLAAALMTVGLLTKTALFPLHIWLPAAHAGAPAAASALISGLVVKGSFVLIIRVWVDALPGVATPMAAQLLGALGAAAILVGSVLALRQVRLKMLIAYSTVAQIGYLFLAFPLASATQLGTAAWTGGILQAVSHALAKASMCLAAGLITKTIGHDRILDMEGIGRVLPIPLFAFGLAGLSLMGLPPSGGFMAKWLLLRAAIEGAQWWWVLIIVSGGLLTGGYLFRVLSRALAQTDRALPLRAPVDRRGEVLVLGLALLSIGVGLVPLASLSIVHIGRAL